MTAISVTNREGGGAKQGARQAIGINSPRQSTINSPRQSTAPGNQQPQTIKMILQENRRK